MAISSTLTVNQTWNLQQGTITLTRNGGGTYTIDMTNRHFPTIDKGAAVLLLVYETLGGQQTLAYWKSATVKDWYELDSAGNWREFEWDSATGITTKTDYGTYATA